MTDREPLALECAMRSAAASGITNVADFQDMSARRSSRAQVATLTACSASCESKCGLLQQ